jgi:hypothetical protein
MEFQSCMNLANSQLHFLSLLFSCRVSSYDAGPLVGSADSFVKNSEHLVKLAQENPLQSGLACFNIVGLLTNVPVKEVLQVIRNRLHMDASLNCLCITQSVNNATNCYFSSTYTFNTTCFGHRWPSLDVLIH